ncbi:MAG: hypothetical protein AAGA48_15665 [Myxococcota bacterium]
MLAVLWIGCTVTAPDGSTTDPQVPTDPDTGSATSPLPTTDTGPVDPGSPFASIRAEPLALYGSVIRVVWSQRSDADVFIEYSFEADSWLSSPVRSLTEGTHEELLLGVPYGQTVTYRLIAGTDVASMDRTIDTDPLPSIVPTAGVLANQVASTDSDVPYFLVGISEDGSLRRTWITLIDRQARVLWAHRTPSRRNSMHPRLSRDGNSFLIDHSSYFADLPSQGADSQVLEMKIDGSVVQEWDTPGQHHPYTDLPDGSLAYARYVFSGLRDDRIEIISPKGEVRTLFSCRDFLEESGLPAFDCGANTMNYDESRDVFLFSMFTLDTVFEVNGTTGDLERVFGALSRPEYASITGLDAWSFDPPESAFDYQHNPTFTAAGTLLLSTHVDEYSEELVAREYTLASATQTLQQIWSFGEGEGVDGCQMGEAHRLPSGNTLHNYGTHAVLREVTDSGQVVWDVRWESEEHSCFGGPTTPGHQVLRSNPVGPDLYRFAPERP